MAELAGEPRVGIARGQHLACEKHLGELLDYLTVVGDGPAGAGATLQQQALSRPRVDREVYAVPVLGLVTVVAGMRDEVVARQPEPRRSQIEQARHDLTSAVRQPRVARCGDAEGLVIRCA